MRSAGLIRTYSVTTGTLPRIARIASSTNRSMASSAKPASRLLPTGGDTEVPFIYGTAWKNERTKELVELAVRKGFRKVDTAAQPRHYQEPLVGEALREVFKAGVVKREDVYVSTTMLDSCVHLEFNYPSYKRSTRRQLVKISITCHTIRQLH